MKQRAQRTLKDEPVLGCIDGDAGELEIRLSKAIKSEKKPAQNLDQEKIEMPIPVKKSAIFLASALLLVSSVMFIVDQLFSPDSFQIERLHITADIERIKPEQIQQEVLPLIQNNYFAVDLKHIERVVQAMPWVDQVSVRREWPRAVHLRLTEQQPLAQWGDDAYLNVRAESFGVGGLPVADLPYLHGPESAKQTLLERYQQWQPRFARKNLLLSRLTLTDRHAYQAEVVLPREDQKRLTEQALINLYAEKDQVMPVLDWSQIEPATITLRLGKDDIEKRLQRFLNAYPQAMGEQLLMVDTVDLRYPNGFTLKFSQQKLPQEFLQVAIKLEKKVNE